MEIRMTSVVQGLLPNVASVRTLKILSYFVALVSCKIEEYKHNLIIITQYLGMAQKVTLKNSYYTREPQKRAAQPVS
jgi:hypothetical protein